MRVTIITVTFNSERFLRDCIESVIMQDYPDIEHILIDEDLLKYPDLWAAAGTPHAVFNLRAADLQPLTNGKVISIK